MSKEKRFVQSKYVHHLQDTKTDMHYYLTSEKIGCRDLFDEIERLTEENKRLRTQLLLCKQSKDGRFQVWEVPPIPVGTTISFSTNGDKK